ncbi:hypothetical protein V2J09_006816 [Rumex salicifolius]
MPPREDSVCNKATCFKPTLSKNLETSRLNQQPEEKRNNDDFFDYGGRILPRPSDGHLRYVGGHTRVVSFLRSVSFSELMAKLSEMCGHPVALRCQLPNEEMDVLVSVKSDEDLASVIDEYDRASLFSGKQLKIRAILSPTKPIVGSNNSSTRSSSSACSDLSPTKSSELEYRQFNRSAAETPVPCPVRSNNCGSAAVFPQFVRNRTRFQPCHVQANFRPFVLHSNYRQ